MKTLNVTKISRQAKLQQILSGISSQMSGVTSVMLGGKQVQVSDLVKQIQSELDGIEATAQAKATYATKVQTERTVRASLNPTLRQFRSWVVGSFGDTQDSVKALEAFGYFPRKSDPLTVEEKAQAIAKGKATKAKDSAGTPAPQPAPVTKA